MNKMGWLRHIAVEGFIRFAYWSGLVNLFYCLNKGSKRIIMFHNVLPDKLFNKQHVSEFVSNSESEFRLIIREVKKKFSISNDLCDTSSATLTFDDGYLNQYECAKKILDEEGHLPAIIFVAGRLIGTRDPHNALIADLLMLWVSMVPDGIMPFRNGSRLWTWLKDLYPQMENNEKSFGADVLYSVNNIYPFQRIFAACDSEYLRLRFLGITEEQIRELRSNGWVVGWHTKNHFPLSKLNLSVMEQEMTPPNNIYQTAVFAYPYGGTTQVDARCVETASDLKYPCAVSAVPYYNQLSSKYFLPRMELRADKYRLHYELSGLRYFIMKRKLLPRIQI